MYWGGLYFWGGLDGWDFHCKCRIVLTTKITVLYNATRKLCLPEQCYYQAFLCRKRFEHKSSFAFTVVITFLRQNSSQIQTIILHVNFSRHNILVILDHKRRFYDLHKARWEHIVFASPPAVHCFCNVLHNSTLAYKPPMFTTLVVPAGFDWRDVITTSPQPDGIMISPPPRDLRAISGFTAAFGHARSANTIA